MIIILHICFVLIRSFQHLFFVLLMWCNTVEAAVVPVDKVARSGVKLIENLGQWQQDILFKAHIPGGVFYITETGFVYALTNHATLHSILHHNASGVVEHHNFKVNLLNIKKPTVKKFDPSTEYYNYFVGSNPLHWRGGCRAYGRIVLESIYDGIDMEIIALSDRLKINYHIKPFADISLIQFAYEGIATPQLDNENLILQTALGDITELAPVSFQPDLTPDSIYTTYTLSNGKVGFACHTYNPLFKLIIDPDIIFSTFSGSVADNFGFTATYDATGAGYAGGTVYAPGFPTTTGSFQQTFQGGNEDGNVPRDIGILKFSPDGTNLLYCTYLGGSGNEQPHSMICTPNGELIVFGTTSSTNFPTSTNAYDRTHNGGVDIFITRFNSLGSAIIGSTYLGGSLNDGINGEPLANAQYNSNSSPLRYNFADQYRGEVIIDLFGNIVIASCTKSSVADGYPIVNGFQNNFGGVQDGILARFNATLSQLQFSSYLGGAGHDAIYSVVTDNLNNYIVSGGTNSSNLATESQFPYRGGVDAYVARINSNGNQLTRFIYFGTPQYDQSYFVKRDNRGRIYITGQTESNSFPVLGGAYRVNGAKHFISIFNATLDTLIISTTFGRSGASKPALVPSAFMVDVCNQIYFSGWGGQTNSIVQQGVDFTTQLPISDDAFQKTTDGSDFYLIVFTPDMGAIAHATYLGDNLTADHVDGGTSRFDPQGIIYQSVCAGCNNANSQFPTTPGAWSRTNKGLRPNFPSAGCNNALFKMSLNVSVNPPQMTDTLITLLAGDSLNFTSIIIDKDNDSIFTDWSGSFAFASPDSSKIILQRMVGQNRITLRWRSNCQNIGDTLVLRIISRDNGCPIVRWDTSWIKVAVIAPRTPPTPFPECLTYINSNTAKIEWNNITSNDIKKLHIYRSVNGSAFDSLFTNYNLNTSIFIDTGAQNHQNINYCYYLNTENTCNITSPNSRTICSIFKDDTLEGKSPFIFSADSIFYVRAFDTLLVKLPVSTTDPMDSLTIEIINIQRLHPGINNLKQFMKGLEMATIDFTFTTDCANIGDTLMVSYIVVDNQCPTPRSMQGLIRIVVLPLPITPTPAFDCINRINDNQVIIGFSQFNPSKFHKSLNLIRKNPEGSILSLAAGILSSSFKYTDNAPNNKIINYCYALVPINVCDESGDTSAYICTLTRPEDFPDRIDVVNVSVINNKDIEIKWNNSNDTLFAQYHLYRSRLTSPENKSIIHSSSASNDVVYIDESVDVSTDSYCYYLTQENACGLESIEKDSACSILLKGLSIPFEHKLNWNKYTYWNGDVDYYEILKQEPLQSPLIAGTTKSNQTAFTDDRLNIDNGLYFYTITAVELTKFIPLQSRSNTVELIQSPHLYVPNAFTPNGDGVNDDWRPRPVFVKEYELRLYDRWGRLVFSTNDKYDFFRGESLGSNASTDAYVYVITYSGWDGTKYSTKGTVTILR
jgi:gliding motility-associated-like protein